MSSKQRIMDTISHKKTDRIPFDFWARDDVIDSLLKYLNLKDEEELLQRFRIDIRKINITETHSEFLKKGIKILSGNSPSSKEQYIFYENGTFENAWGIIKRQSSDVRSLAL